MGTFRVTLTRMNRVMLERIASRLQWLRCLGPGKVSLPVGRLLVMVKILSKRFPTGFAYLTLPVSGTVIVPWNLEAGCNVT